MMNLTGISLGTIVEINNSTLKLQYGFFVKIYPVMFGIGSFWNFLIIFYFVKINLKKTLKKMSSYHFLIINLAFADLCSSVGVSIVRPHDYKPSWFLGEFGCTFLRPFVYNICPIVSSWILVLISHARYKCIVNPLQASYSKKKYAVICLFIWLVPFLGNVYFFMNKKLVMSGRVTCVKRQQNRILCDTTVHFLSH